MRILHRINLDVAAGVENQFRAFIRHPEAQRAFQNDLIYASSIHPTLAADILPYLEFAASFKKLGRISVPRWPAWPRERRLAALVAARRPDAMLAWSGFAREALSKAAQRTGVPLIYREGGGAWYAHSPAAAARFSTQLRGAICNTYASLRMLRLKWHYEGPARVCLGGIRPDILAAARSGEERQLGTRLRLGTAARLAPEKGVCLAVHAVKRLRDQGLDCELHIAGDGPDRDALIRLAADLGITGHIQFLGSVEDMATFYRRIDVLLHPALQEPLGNVTIEASAFGVPVVATRVDGMAETIKHGETGMTVPADQVFSDFRSFGGGRSGMLSNQVYDPDRDALRPVAFSHPRSLAAAVAGIVDDPQAYARMSRAAAIHARTSFDFERYVREFTAAVSGLVHGKPFEQGRGLGSTAAPEA